MDHVFQSGAIATPPAPPATPSSGYPLGMGPDETTTKIGEYWFYMVTEECRNVAALLGQAPDHLKVDQMATAIQLAIAEMGNTKANASHTHPISQVVDLQAKLDSLQTAINTHTHTFLKNGTGTATLDAAGNLLVTGNVSGYSDERLKTDIKVIPQALAKVKQIRGVTFRRRDLVNDQQVHVGVIAQEVQAVQPELVQADPHGKLSVAYGNMVGLLIEAVKELSGEVESLKAQLNAKEGGNS